MVDAANTEILQSIIKACYSLNDGEVVTTGKCGLDCSLEHITKLLQGGADPNIRKEYRHGHWTLLIGAARRFEESGRLPLVLLLLEKGANIEDQDSEGWSALSYAAFDGRLDVVKLLVEKGANKEHQNKAGATPLCLAAEAGQPEVVQFLVDEGADLNTKNILGNTPLGCAREFMCTSSAKILEAAGAER
eukprot:TRINITY_DN107178_c0_g1_i1.p1 TRINITY_DN107178_c0_g1~~TRINITY_DN107178_c0_g1_i1.p1  ORF type:complete len:190 (-),score=41.40 TRINITY_DN107178_c0_g1_i1:118-687(-)